MNLLQVKGFRKVGIPHLHDQGPIQIEELIPLPIITIVGIQGFKVVGEDEINVGDPLLCSDYADLVGLEERVGRVRVRVRGRIVQRVGDVLPAVIEDEVVSARVVVQEGGDLYLREGKRTNGGRRHRSKTTVSFFVDVQLALESRIACRGVKCVLTS